MFKWSISSGSYGHVRSLPRELLTDCHVSAKTWVPQTSAVFPRLVCLVCRCKVRQQSSDLCEKKKMMSGGLQLDLIMQELRDVVFFLSVALICCATLGRLLCPVTFLSFLVLCPLSCSLLLQNFEGSYALGVCRLPYTKSSYISWGLHPARTWIIWFNELRERPCEDNHVYR